ncbi:MAG TPA: 2OG-Fe(II) oxygenase [Burkholderiales bacterium]|nr:2OG-Fe(II) oxygenase [Burkholderiales bacterium]
MGRSGDKTAPDPQFQGLVLERYAGNPHAIAELGERLLVGRDAPQSIADGAQLIAEAAAQGERHAWCRMAVLAASGIGQPQSWAGTFAALERAAALGDAEALRQQVLLRRIGIASEKEACDWLAAPVAEAVHDVPRLVRYRNLLSPELCEHWREHAAERLVPARVHDARGGGLRLDPMRTNTGAVFSLLDTDLVMQLTRERIARAAGVSLAQLEPPEVLHYAVGETYRAHVDFFHPRLPTFADEMRSKGQRIRTCLVYLNDDFEGGATEFPKLGIAFRGSRGDALVFDNVGANGLGDLRTLHTGLAPTVGEKWLLSQWIRSKPQRVA